VSKDVRIGIIVGIQKGFGERNVSENCPLEGRGFCNRSFPPELYNLELNDTRTLLVKISTPKLEKRRLFQCSIRNENLVLVFFCGCIISQSSKITISRDSYKLFGLVPSSFIKVKRQTHSQISVRIHYGRREECRPTKYSSCLQKWRSFHYLLYTC
jgi:hypothetical protein